MTRDTRLDCKKAGAFEMMRFISDDDGRVDETDDQSYDIKAINFTQVV
ncbi:unnamed protein product [uncultured virus]|nr:unnamed protein product [uncultured virus]